MFGLLCLNFTLQVCILLFQVCIPLHESKSSMKVNHTLLLQTKPVIFYSETSVFFMLHQCINVAMKFVSVVTSWK